jgi:hypothetical protein
MLKYFVMATAMVVASSFAIATTETEDSTSTRSTTVDYSKTGPKPAASQYAPVLNEAQKASLEVLNSGDVKAIAIKTREQIIEEHKLAAKNQNNQASGISKSNQYQTQASPYISFDIYDASTRLLEDEDYDGYFQTFSVSFDADIISDYSNQRARVFADLYLSRDGGPWEHYYTTDAFTIYDDSSDDEFEVLTTLDLGFRTDRYDVLIDLYEVGYSDIVATVSGDDINSLYALPLESADRDQYIPNHYDSSVTLSAGSLSLYSLFALIAVCLIRFKSQNAD